MVRFACLPLLVACGSGSDEGTDPDGFDPDGDIDGDGFTNQEEVDLGTDPEDAADVPYAGGWARDACRDDIVPTGNDVGQVAEDFALQDQFDQTFHLWDFCDRVLLIEFGGFT